MKTPKKMKTRKPNCAKSFDWHISSFALIRAFIKEAVALNGPKKK